VTAHLQDADRPAQGGQQNEGIADQCARVAPGEGERVEHDQEAEDAETDAQHAPARQRLAKEEHGAGDHPQRRGVAQHNGPAGRHQCEADRHEAGEEDHVQDGNPEDDRHVAAAG
jgi:hypothetical protein